MFVFVWSEKKKKKKKNLEEEEEQRKNTKSFFCVSGTMAHYFCQSRME